MNSFKIFLYIFEKKISTEYQFGTLFHHINFGSKQRSFDVLFRSTLHWWTLKCMESSSNCLITYPGKITNHSIFLFRNLDQRSKRDHKWALYSVQEWKHKIWPVNLNTERKNAVLTFFIIDFFIISELLKHINSSNNLKKWEYVHLLQKGVASGTFGKSDCLKPQLCKYHICNIML